MRVLYLTDCPILGSTASILRGWLIAGRTNGVDGFVAAASESVLTAWLRAEGFPVRVTEMSWLSRSRPFPAIWQAARLAIWARRKGIEIVHCNEHNVHPFGYLVASMARLPVVCSVRCKFGPAFGKWAFRRYPPSALMWSTQSIKNECLGALPTDFPVQKIHIVPEGVDMRTLESATVTREDFRRQLGITSTEVIVGMACALRPGKRVEDFLVIAERVRSKHPNTRFVLAGAGVQGEEWYTDALIPCVRRAELRRIITWVGQVAQIRTFMDAIDVFVSTSEHESFGMSVCESMACGKPVCGYAACSVAEVVGDTGLIVETGDIDGLTDAVERLVADEVLRCELGHMSRRRALDSFDPAKSIEQLRHIYSSIINERTVGNVSNDVVIEG